VSVAHELHDDVERSLHLKHDKYSSKAANVALDAAHATAFHTGLGAPLYPNDRHALGKYTNEHSVAEFATAIYQKQNIALVADGASSSELAKWAGEFFGDISLPAQERLSLKQGQSKYHGGEQRIAHSHGNAITIAYPGASLSAPKPELAVLAALLGGQQSIKWAASASLLGQATASTGASVSTVHTSYTDAGLLTITISGSASAVREAAQHPAKALKSIADGSVGKEDITRAIAKAKFAALDTSQLCDVTVELAGTGLVHSGKVFESTDAIAGIESVTPEKVQSVSLEVSSLCRRLPTNNNPPGGKGPPRRQGVGGRGWRLVCAPVRGGDWGSGIDLSFGGAEDPNGVNVPNTRQSWIERVRAVNTEAGGFSTLRYMVKLHGSAYGGPHPHDVAPSRPSSSVWNT
jgi:hypothetical protein